MSEYTYELVNKYKYPADRINEIGGAGFDSGWVGPENEQIRIIISTDILHPCSEPIPNVPVPA
jgi:hypothetical protein